ncbi:endo-1,4-beta-xylanase A [Spirochaetia bacterium]|nr:endo-1,4-beta-xylanase A [Spirochaetia bacterium]
MSAKRTIWQVSVVAVTMIIAGVGFALSGCASSTKAGGGGKETVIYQEGFENSSGGWQPRGGASLKAAPGKAHSGSAALFVSGRGKTWHGAIRPFVNMKPGQTYRISVWAMFDDETAPSQGLNISIQQNVEGQGETYSTIGADRLPRGEWVYLEGEYTVPRSKYEMVVSLYFESAYKSDEGTLPADLFDFYLDDITITRLPPAPPPAVEKDIPALSDFFPEFPLGAAIDSRYLDPGNIHHELLRHFNVLVYGNEMKPDALEKVEGRFTWANGDALIKYAEEHNKKVRGHTLVWHQQTPEWMFQGSGPDGLATKEQLYARMERHIKEAVGHFKGKIYTWDVVNEAVGDSNDGDQAGELRNSKYYRIAGSHEYIANAFRWAREADPDALLCINDYSVEASGAKQDGFYNLVKTLLDEGVPIDVVGLQCHINTSWPTVADLRAAIRRFASLGVKVQITEFDMSIYANSGEAKKKADREILLDQAFKYRALFEMLREEARAGNLDMVLVWGIADDDTWLNNHPVTGRTDYPLFFGKDLRAKPAYWILVNPEKLPIQIKKIEATRADHPPTDSADPAWALVSPRDIADIKGNVYGWFKVMWTPDALRILLRVDDASKDDADGITVFIEPKNQKLEARSDIAFTKEFKRSEAIRDDAAGYTLLASVPLEGKLDSKLGFDIRIQDGQAQHSWNDFDNSQENVSLNYGTVTLRNLPLVTYAKRGSLNLEGRRIDMAIWEKVTPVPMNTKSDGFTPEGSTFRVLWDENYIYTLVDVIDPTLDDASTTVHEQDSVEVFIDQNNGKTASYEPDDGQYRVSFRNSVSFNGGDSERFKSRTMVFPGGYRVETAAPLTAIKGRPGTLIGYDVQINDATSGGRTGIRNWADSSNMGYQDTSGYGILVLTE